jgi:CheY-like chemotaxis protein
VDKPVQCILIDDDQDDQEIFCMALYEIDSEIKCLTINSGIEALEILRTNPLLKPAYIFIDVNMPKMNGLDCLREIKKLSHLSATAVIMYSTTSEEKILNTSKALGASDFIIKPPGVSLLKQRLLGILSKKSS